MRKTDLLLSAFYIIALVISATQLSSIGEMNSSTVSAKLWPWLVIGSGLVMGLVETIRTIVARQPADAPTFEDIWAKAFAMRRMLILGLFILYLVLIQPIGFLIVTALFLFGTIVILTPQPNARSVAAAAAVTAGTLGLIYLLLVVYLQAFLP